MWLAMLFSFVRPIVGAPQALEANCIASHNEVH
jgi:hypothetical protein